jgi:hypothetical protein
MMKFDTLVIGHSTKALAYALMMQLPIINPDPHPPWFWDFVPMMPLPDFLHLDIEEHQMHYEQEGKGPVQYACHEYHLWSNFHYLLNLSALMPFADMATMISFQNRNEGTVHAPDGQYSFTANKIILFEDAQVRNLPVVRKNLRMRTQDQFYVQSGTTQELNLFMFPDERFMRRVLFHPKVKGDGSWKGANGAIRRDVLVDSYLKPKELVDFEFSSNAIEDVLSHNFEEKTFHFIKRLTRKVWDIDAEEHESLVFNQMKLEDILKIDMREGSTKRILEAMAR